MDRSGRKRRWKPSQAGSFFLLSSKFEAGDQKVSFTIPSHQLGAATRDGGTLALVDIHFCQSEACPHFRPNITRKVGFPAAPPAWNPTVEVQLPPQVDPEEAVEPEEGFQETLPLPGDPTRSTIAFRRSRGLSDHFFIDYTAGYTRNCSKSTAKFAEDDNVDVFAKKVSTYHLSRINEAYGDMLASPVTLDFVLANVTTPEGLKQTMAKTTITLPPNFNLGFSQKFALEALGYTHRQISAFHPREMASVTVYGFMNPTNAPAAFISEVPASPAKTGRSFFLKKELGAKFVLGATTQKRIAKIDIVTESYIPAFSKRLQLDETFAGTWESVPEEARSQYAKDLLSSILEDVTSEMKLTPNVLLTQMVDGSLYLRSRQSASASPPYPNLTIHFEMPSEVSRSLGLTMFDVRWNGIDDLKVGEYTASWGPSDPTTIASPAKADIDTAVRTTPKKVRTSLYDENDRRGMDEESSAVMVAMLNNRAPLDLDELDREKQKALELAQTEENIRRARALKAEEERSKAEKARKEQEERAAAETHRKLEEERERLKKEEAERQALAEEKEERLRLAAAAALAKATDEQEQTRIEQEETRRRVEEKKAEIERQRIAEENEKKRLADLAAKEAELKRIKDEAEKKKADAEAERIRLEKEEIERKEQEKAAEEERKRIAAAKAALDAAAVEAERQRIEEEERKKELAARIAALLPRRGPDPPIAGPADPALAAPDPPVAAPDPPIAVPAPLRNIPNPAARPETEFYALVDNPHRGHADFVPDGDVLVSDTYTVLFEEGNRTDFVEGLGLCCVLAHIRKDVPLYQKYVCEYPVYWDGHITLSLYDSHLAPISPTRDSLATISLLVNHFSEKQ